MTGTFGDIVLALSASPEMSIVVKATLTLALGLLGVRIAYTARASRRYLVLAATFGVLLLLPLAALVAPPVGIAIRSVPAAAARVETPGPGIGAPRPAATAPVNALVTTTESASTERPTWTMPSIPSVLRTVWMIGVVLFLLPVGITLWRLRAIRRTALTWVEGDAMARVLAAETRVRRTVRVLRHERVAAPMTTGLLAPVILVPADASGWPREALERALVHELEHVRRADWPAHLLARTVCAIYWFHPLVWRAWRLFHLDADRACDDAVLARGEGRAFAEQLVTLAQRVSRERTSPILAMAGRGDLSRRVMAVLDPQQDRGRAGARWAALVMVLALASVIVVSPLTAVESANAIVTADDRWLGVEPPAMQTPEPAAAVRAPRPAAGAQATSVAVTADRFETVSIRQSTAAVSDLERNLSPGGNIPSPAGDSFIADRVSLERLVLWAYGIGGNRPGVFSAQFARPWATIEGVPAWGERFDVRAKAPVAVPEPPEGTLGPMHGMVQNLLADRFKLFAHWEPRARSVYVLTRASGAPGPQLRQSTLDCADRLAVSDFRARLQGATAQWPGGLVCSSNAYPGREGTDTRFVIRASAPGKLVAPDEIPGTYHIRLGQAPLATLVRFLESSLGGQVVDRTGLSGNFDLELRYTRYSPDLAAPASSTGVLLLRPLAETPVRPDWPVLADALRDQLGIELAVETAEGEALVIDRAEPPAEDWRSMR